MKTLDCRKDQCPAPVIEARKLLLSVPGETVTVLVGDDAARQNVGRMATGQGYQVKESPVEGGFALELVPGGAPEASSATTVGVAGPTVVFVSSDCMGGGNDELGAVLMKNFLITLLELETPPDKILFVNAGVKLTSQGSDALEALNRLSCNGADIASCGLCLDFFGLKEQLAVGRVGNMLDIVETLAGAGRIIRP